MCESIFLILRLNCTYYYCMFSFALHASTSVLNEENKSKGMGENGLIKLVSNCYGKDATKNYFLFTGYVNKPNYAFIPKHIYKYILVYKCFLCVWVRGSKYFVSKFLLPFVFSFQLIQ